MTGAATFDAEVSTRMTTDVVRQAMYVAVIGSREFPELGRVRTLVDLLHPEATVVSGGANGVDETATLAAVETHRRTAVVAPSKDHHPHDFIGSLLARNAVIVRGSDVVVAFWDGDSRGTAHGIELALTCHGFCIVVLPGQPPAIWERYRVKPQEKKK